MKNSRWRYSLSTLFILTTICAIGAYYWARKVERERRIENAWNYFETHTSPSISGDMEDDSTNLLLQSGDRISDVFSKETFKALNDLEQIDGIMFLDPPEFSVDQYRQLFSIPRLKKLHFQSDKIFKLIDAECLVETAPNIQKLYYSGRVTPKAVIKLSNLKKLEELAILFPNHEHDNDEGETHFQLGSMPSLRELNVDWPGQITVSSMPLLKNFEINRGAELTKELTPGYAATASLETQPLLESLKFDKTRFLRIASQPSLKSLMGSGIIALRQDMERLSHFRKLERLSITGWFSNKAIADIRKLETVQDLTLSAVGGVEDVPHKNPQQLFEHSFDRFEGLDHTRLDLSPLKECKNLTSLTITCEMDYADEIRFLSQMINLRKLDIADVKVKSLAGGHRKLFLSEIIEEIGSLSFLDELTVGSIDMEESKIKAALPKTKVILRK